MAIHQVRMTLKGREETRTFEDLDDAIKFVMEREGASKLCEGYGRVIELTLRTLHRYVKPCYPDGDSEKDWTYQIVSAD